MDHYRFLLSRRWLVLGLVCLIIAVACVFLGRWQWNRHLWRDASNQLIENNYNAAPVPLTDVLTPQRALAEQDTWRPVLARGHFLPDSTVLLRNRPVEGTSAVHVLALFQLADDDGPLLVVDRGWLPLGDSGTEPDSIPDPPADVTQVTVRLRPAEAASDRQAFDGQVFAIAPDQVIRAAGLSGVTAYQAYGNLAAQTPSSADQVQALPAPQTDPGPHLSYAMQWWCFALVALAAFVVLARRERQERAGGGEGKPAVPTRARRTATKARSSQVEDEDLLIEAQMAASQRPPKPDQASETSST